MVHLQDKWIKASTLRSGRTEIGFAHRHEKNHHKSITAWIKMKSTALDSQLTDLSTQVNKKLN